MTIEESRLRDLPSIDAVLRALLDRSASTSHKLALACARQAVAEARIAAQARMPMPTFDQIVDVAERLVVRSDRPSLRSAINATGVVLHTNLGRAPLSGHAIQAMADISVRYSNLEFGLDAGRRGSRHDHGRELVCRVTGAEDAVIVNNNAAAVFFVLQALVAPRNVIVSRSEAVEIGGGFRIPDVIRQSGATIVEVGTTNRTYVSDYATALDEKAAAILRVHASNFRILGFTAKPATRDLATLARERGVLLLDDLGSGALIPTEQFGLAHEPMVQESLQAGADLVLFSGDKLVGGPQCGVIAGRTELVQRLREHPLARVLRVDKLTLAALAATLEAYLGDSVREEIPIWRMLSADPDTIAARARTWIAAAGRGEVVGARTMVGGGSLPGEGVMTSVVALRVINPDGLASALRGYATPIITRIEDDRVLLDPRTVDPVDDMTVAEALRYTVHD